MLGNEYTYKSTNINNKNITKSDKPRLRLMDRFEKSLKLSKNTYILVCL